MSWQWWSRSPSPCGIQNSVFKDTNSRKRAHCSTIEYKGSEEIQVYPLNSSEKILCTKFPLDNDHRIVDNTIPTSDTNIDNDVLSYKHTLVSTDDSQILGFVVPNDEAIFHKISSSVVDNNYSTTKVDGKVYFPQHDFYNNDGAIID